MTIFRGIKTSDIPYTTYRKKYSVVLKTKNTRFVMFDLKKKKFESMS